MGRCYRLEMSLRVTGHDTPEKWLRETIYPDKATILEGFGLVQLTSPSDCSDRMRPVLFHVKQIYAVADDGFRRASRRR